MHFKRIFLVVLDSVGVGEAKDAHLYKDEGSNTLGHVNDHCNLFIPNLKKLGFLDTINMSNNTEVDAYYTIARPSNIGKDSLTSHYELVGVKNPYQFKSFIDKGLPLQFIQQIELMSNRKVIGNKYANYNNILLELGNEQVENNHLIVFLSSDGNIQIAAHEDTIPTVKLYLLCEKVRRLAMIEEWLVGRIIARPFAGKPGKFKYTSDKKEFAIKAPENTIISKIKNKGLNVIGVGKVNNLFDGNGITKMINSSSNIDGINKLTDIMGKNFSGLCFVSLSDFDSSGHEKNVEKFANLIEELDVEIPMILNKLEIDDLLILTGNHGCDPVISKTGHTRENVPVVIYSRSFKNPKKLDVLETHADIAASIAKNFELEPTEIGTSFLDKLV